MKIWIDADACPVAIKNVKEAHTMRNLNQELREAGMIFGGPSPFSVKDINSFANAFDRELTRLKRV